MKHTITLLIVLLITTGISVPAQQYEVIDLVNLGGNYSQAFSINEDGIIAGWATATNSGHPVLWKDNTIIEILDNPPGYAGEAVAVNVLGQIIVAGETSPQSYRSFLWENDTYIDLGVIPGRNETIVEDINNMGQVVGRSFSLGANNGAGFIWEAGVMTDLGTLGGYTSAFAINNVGQVVGRTQAEQQGGTEEPRAFIWENNVMIALDPLPEEDYSQAFGINDSGDVVGSSWHGVLPQFFIADQSTLWLNGGAEIIDLGLTPGPIVCQPNFPFYTDNIALAINNHGQIVGHAQCIASGAALAAFLWDNGVMYNLNDLIPAGSGWQLLRANDINDEGHIVGIGINPDGDLHAFHLIPATVSTTENVSTPPDDYLLSQNYPNPFNPVTNIKYTIPRAGNIKIRVFNIMGEEIQTLVDGFKEAGDYKISFDAADLSSGVYYYRLEANGYTSMKKMVLLK